MTIGTLGDVSFYASSEGVQTFEDLKIKSSVNYSEHKLHKKKPLVEFTGKNADEVSFDMELSVLLGATPNQTYTKLKKMMDDGKLVVLVVGTTVIGTKWVITDISKQIEQLYKDGQLISCKVSVTLLEYN